jgi:hypothetical protein
VPSTFCRNSCNRPRPPHRHTPEQAFLFIHLLILPQTPHSNQMKRCRGR